ncbi:MAG: DNA-binding protein [Candidatus Acidiferrales bacterium]
MGESSPLIRQPEKSSEDRLESWKEIAEYLRRDVTTVQRWEKREGMPVRRHLHDRMGSVYAFRAELDAWTRSRAVRTSRENGENGSAAEPMEQTCAANVPRFGRSALVAIGLLAVLAIGAILWLGTREYSWRSPIANARFQRITDFDGVAEAAAISRDGKFVAFQSDRSGKMDVWITQVGSGEFHNLTHGSAPELANPALRSLIFSPDGSLVLFWGRQQGQARNNGISIWAVPTLGGEPRIYLEGAAELDWSPDGSRIAYHTPGAGDPLFVADANLASQGKLIFTAPTGLHSHFPLWSLDGALIYVVQGALPDNFDIWRVPAAGGRPERVTSHNAYVGYPVLLDKHSLIYLAAGADGSGPWLYSMDLNRRISHQLTSGLDRYTSLAASADHQRLVLTLANPKSTLWRLKLGDPRVLAVPTQIPLTTSTGSVPRFGPDYLLYLSATNTGESIWKISDGSGTELWNGPGARVFGGPAVSSDGKNVAFSVERGGQALLYTMKDDGSEARIVTSSLKLQGSPAWSPDGKWITSAAEDRGVPHLIRIPIDGSSSAGFVSEYSVDPAWAPNGSYLLYSGADIGTKFSVKAATADAAARHLPAELTLTRGARHLAFLNGGNELLVLQGEIQHKNLWLIDLQTGAARQLTTLPADFDVRDFDVSPDGGQVVLERAEARSDVVLMDLPQP